MASHLDSLLTVLFLVLISIEKIKSDIFSDTPRPLESTEALRYMLDMLLSTANDTAPPLPGEFDHYTFAIRWPPSYCREQNDSHCPDKFVIYGFYPTYNNGDYPVYCISRDSAYSLYNHGNLHLWSHQWTKHGTCSGLTQLQYFKTAIDLINELDFLQRLNSLGYRPSKTATYDPGMVISHYKEKYGVLIRIKCETNCAGQEKLTEIHFKVNKDGETLESISGPSNLCQSTEVSFPE
ncbi:ribonuclease T2 [Ranunculus cassubicifolius]